MSQRPTEEWLADYLIAHPGALRKNPITRALIDRAVKASDESKPNKYHNRKTEVNGEIFDSEKEAERHQELLLLQRGGQISQLERQPKYVFQLNGIRIGTYKPDFRYLDHQGFVVVEDVKSKPSKTTAYRLRKRMMHAFHGLKVLET